MIARDDDPMAMRKFSQPVIEIANGGSALGEHREVARVNQEIPGWDL